MEVFRKVLKEDNLFIKYYLSFTIILCICSCNLGNNGIHIKFISKCKDMKIGEIRFQQLGYSWMLRSDTSLIFIENNKDIFKNGDTISFQSGSIFCSYHFYKVGIYKDFIIYQDNDTVTKFIELDLKDTVGDY